MANRIKLALTLSLAAFATTALAESPPGSMSAETFYTKAVALNARGIAAAFSPDFKRLIHELDYASAAVKQENDSATRRGQPVYCPPADHQRQGMDSNAIIAAFGAIPQNERRAMTTTQAWRRIAIQRFPCR